MKRLAINPRFMNEACTDLIPQKIHTIRANHDYWKRFEGQDIAIYIWEGVAYRSKQKVVCVKKLVSVQEVIKSEVAEFWEPKEKKFLPLNEVYKNDGFDDKYEFINWFVDYPFGKMAILHFTDFRY